MDFASTFLFDKVNFLQPSLPRMDVVGSLPHGAELSGLCGLFCLNEAACSDLTLSFVNSYVIGVSTLG